MAKRDEVLANGEVYHVLNRSIANIDVFVGSRNLTRILGLTDFYRFPQDKKYSLFKTFSNIGRKDYLEKIKKRSPLVEIHTYSFMPNHYHFLLKQISENGISRFISNFQNGFAKYFNLKTGRDGGLFKRPFKSRRISTDEELLHVSRYIHLNPVTSYLMEFKDLENSKLTSYPFYLDRKKGDLVETRLILGIFGPPKNYSKFLSDQVDYQRELQKIKRLMLE